MITIEVQNSKNEDEKPIAVLIARLLDTEKFNVEGDENIYNFWHDRYTADRMSLIGIQKETTIKIGVDENAN